MGVLVLGGDLALGWQLVGYRILHHLLWEVRSLLLVGRSGSVPVTCPGEAHLSIHCPGILGYNLGCDLGSDKTHSRCCCYTGSCCCCEVKGRIRDLGMGGSCAKEVRIHYSVGAD